MLHKLELNNLNIKVAIADTKESRYTGLSNTPRLGSHKGLLFIFPNPGKVSMVMRDMSYSLDFIVLDKNWKIIQLESLEQDSKKSMNSTSKAQMVLEVNKGVIKEALLSVGMTLKPAKELETQLSGVTKFKHGGTFEKRGDKVYEVTTDDIAIEDDKMQVLNTHGEVVANIESGARIFSRPDTKTLIKLMKAGDKLKLADKMIEIIKRQDTQKAEYVKN